VEKDSASRHHLQLLLRQPFYLHNPAISSLHIPTLPLSPLLPLRRVPPLLRTVLPRLPGTAHPVCVPRSVSRPFSVVRATVCLTFGMDWVFNWSFEPPSSDFPVEDFFRHQRVAPKGVAIFCAVPTTTAWIASPTRPLAVFVCGYRPVLIINPRDAHTTPTDTHSPPFTLPEASTQSTNRLPIEALTRFHA
jgi:hypothetical protein